jgi:hypothetical protein
MRKSAFAAILVLLALEAPADACHRFAVWHFPYRQSCGVAERMRYRAQAMAVPMAPRPIAARAIHKAIAAAPEIPLPDLRDIEWGAIAVESDRARLMLKAILEMNK